MRVRVPAVVFADVPGDSVCSEAVLDGGFHDESIPTPLMEAAGDEGGHLSVPPSPPGEFQLVLPLGVLVLKPYRWSKAELGRA